MKDICGKIAAALLLGLLFLAGCQTSQEKLKAENPVEFTMVEPDDIPEELLEIIEKNKTNEIKMTFESQGNTYLIRGYGEQKTGGYSIAVNGCFLDGEAIHADTSLLGPKPEMKPAKEPSYPYVVLKIKGQGKNVIFD